MEKCLLDLPNELLNMILFYVIDRPWKNDVHDFLSFTSTCRHLRELFYDQRFWERMALRRDVTCKIPPENSTWFEHCQQVYSQRTILGDELKEKISRYNDGYFCTIEKVLIWPHRIRIYIDERGDNSVGSIQDPLSSMIAIATEGMSIHSRSNEIRASNGMFSIADETSQYLGYLDFPCIISVDAIGKNLVFQYGFGGYANAILFHIDPTFIKKHYLTPLFRSVPHSSPNQILSRADSR